MYRLVIPLTLIGVAVAIFFGYIHPEYKKVLFLQKEIARLDEAQVTKEQAERKIDELRKEMAQVSQDDLAKLDSILPRKEEVDPTVLVNDINNVAFSHTMILNAVKYDSFPLENEKLGAYEVQFGVSAPYSDFFSFIKDLQDSLALYDVISIDFKSSEDGVMLYNVKVRRYWRN